LTAEMEPEGASSAAPYYGFMERSCIFSAFHPPSTSVPRLKDGPNELKIATAGSVSIGRAANPAVLSTPTSGEGIKVPTFLGDAVDDQGLPSRDFS
jgi:hypothetical protein